MQRSLCGIYNLDADAWRCCANGEKQPFLCQRMNPKTLDDSKTGSGDDDGKTHAGSNDRVRIDRHQYTYGSCVMGRCDVEHPFRGRTGLSLPRDTAITEVCLRRTTSWVRGVPRGVREENYHSSAPHSWPRGGVRLDSSDTTSRSWRQSRIVAGFTRIAFVPVPPRHSRARRYAHPNEHRRAMRSSQARAHRQGAGFQDPCSREDGTYHTTSAGMCAASRRG